MTYEYLKKYIPGGNGINDNWFVPVTFEEIATAEERIGKTFPSQLKQFYEEIGNGMLRAPHEIPEGYESGIKNEILSPEDIANILLLGHDSGLISEEVLETLEHGDLPFFEVGDSSNFMVMKLQSDNPNAVYTDTSIKIEDSLEQFIWRLYYEDPGYYSDIIKAHYAKK